MKRALILSLLVTGCYSMATFRKDTSFAKSTTTVCAEYSGYGDAGPYVARSHLDYAIAQTCIPGAGPVVNGAETKGNTADGKDIICAPVRCQATLLTGQSVPAAE